MDIFDQVSPELLQELDRIMQQFKPLTIRGLAWPITIARLSICDRQYQYHILEPGKNGAPEWHETLLLPCGIMEQTMHRHEYYEFVFVLSGELVHRLENSLFHYQAGDAILLNRGIRHIEELTKDCEVLFLGLHPQYFQRLLIENAAIPGNPQYTAPGIPRFLAESGDERSREYLEFIYTLQQRQSGRLSPVTALAEQLVDIVRRRPAGYAYTVQGLLLQIFAALEDTMIYHMQHTSIDDSTETMLYNRIVRFLEERNGRVTRAELGEAMHYNGDYLNRVVKNQSGRTIHELGQKICAEAAAKLLQDGERSISDIIHQLGYVNQTSFYRTFRQHMGCSPTEYRRNLSK